MVEKKNFPYPKEDSVTDLGHFFGGPPNPLSRTRVTTLGHFLPPLQTSQSRTRVYNPRTEWITIPWRKYILTCLVQGKKKRFPHRTRWLTSDMTARLESHPEPTTTLAAAATKAFLYGSTNNTIRIMSQNVPKTSKNQAKLGFCPINCLVLYGITALTVNLSRS